MEQELNPPPLNDCGGTCLPPFFLSLEQRLHSTLLVRAIELLRESPGTILSVGQWAEKLGVSREHLTRSLSPVVNAHALLQAARVAMAVVSLTHQDRLEAGRALDNMGYSSRTHAFAVFKHSTGLTPTQFWHRAHDDDRPVHTRCVMLQCPLLGAVLEHHAGSN
jgi:AraC-like DNA-binding protein